MKFLIDAQLPRRLAYRLCESGYEAIHTADLPDKNRTTDKEINELSVRGKYVVVTKDADFVDSFTIQRKPYKLLPVSTGNIRNAELESLVLKNISIIEVFSKLINYQKQNIPEYTLSDKIYKIVMIMSDNGRLYVRIPSEMRKSGNTAPFTRLTDVRQTVCSLSYRTYTISRIG